MPAFWIEVFCAKFFEAGTGWSVPFLGLPPGAKKVVGLLTIGMLIFALLIFALLIFALLIFSTRTDTLAHQHPDRHAGASAAGPTRWRISTRTTCRQQKINL